MSTIACGRTIGFERSHDLREFELLEQSPYRAVQAYDWPVYRRLFERAAEQVDAYSRGDRTVSQPAAEIFRLIRESGLSPTPWALEDPERRCPGTFTLLPMMRLVAWGKYASPACVREHYFITGRGKGLVKEVWRTTFEQARVASGLAHGVVRDAILSWNTDWKMRRGKQPELQA